MIGKVTIGKSFGGCVHYVMEKDKAELLQGYGVRSRNAEIATHDFNEVRKQKPSIQNAVWHASISFAYEKYDDEWGVDSVREIRVKWVEERGL